MNVEELRTFEMRPREPTLLKNSEIPETLYRAQQVDSGTTPPLGGSGFIAGSAEAESFLALDPRAKQEIVEAHADWHCRKPSPFVSTTDCPDKVLGLAKVMSKWNGPVQIAVIHPRRVPPGSPGMKCYWWHDLLLDLQAEVQTKARNKHEYIFIGSIPAQAIAFSFQYDEKVNDWEGLDEMVQDEGKHLILLVVDMSITGLLRVL